MKTKLEETIKFLKELYRTIHLSKKDIITGINNNEHIRSIKHDYYNAVNKRYVNLVTEILFGWAEKEYELDNTFIKKHIDKILDWHSKELTAITCAYNQCLILKEKDSCNKLKQRFICICEGHYKIMKNHIDRLVKKTILNLKSQKRWKELNTILSISWMEIENQ